MGSKSARRAGRAFAAGVAAAACWAAAEELGSKKPVRVGGLMFLACAGIVGGVAVPPTWSKAVNAHLRLDALVPQVASAHGAANAAQTTANSANSAASSAQSTANSAQTTANAAMPKSGGTFTGALTVNGNLHCGGTLSSANCGGDAAMSGFDDSDADSAQSSAPALYTQAYEQASTDRINHLITAHNALNSDVTAVINRVNHYIAAIG